MTLNEAIGDIEGCTNMTELKRAMQRIVEAYGFAAYNILDAARPHVEVPFYFGTTGDAWERTYKGNKFVHIDPCVALGRRRSIPFTWDKIGANDVRRGPKSPITRLMEAASDFGFVEGLVIPVHFRDRLGRFQSTSSVFFWRGSKEKFKLVLSVKRHELHLLMVYFTQKSVDLVNVKHRGRQSLTGIYEILEEVKLSPRDRDVLAWAARGKTVAETADILKISERTVETQIKLALKKLNVSNKTHGVAKAITLGMIDI